MKIFLIVLVVDLIKVCLDLLKIEMDLVYIQNRKNKVLRLKEILIVQVFVYI